MPLAHLIESDSWLWYDGRRYAIDAEHDMQRRVGVLAHALMYLVSALSAAIQKEHEQHGGDEPSDKAERLGEQLKVLLGWVRRLQTEGVRGLR